MNMPNYEIPTEMRDLAEKSVDQARKAFEGFISAAQKAAGQVDTTASSVQSNAKSLGSKAMSFAELNLRSAFDHAQKLVRAKDLQEVVSLQTEFARSQISAIQEQAKELGSMVQTSVKSASHSASSTSDEA